MRQVMNESQVNRLRALGNNSFHYENKFSVKQLSDSFGNQAFKGASKNLIEKKVKVHEIGLKKILRLGNNFAIVTIIFHLARKIYVLMLYVPYSRRKFMLKIEFGNSIQTMKFRQDLLGKSNIYVDMNKETSSYVFNNKDSYFSDMRSMDTDLESSPINDKKSIRSSNKFSRIRFSEKNQGNWPRFEKSVRLIHKYIFLKDTFRKIENGFGNQMI